MHFLKILAVVAGIVALLLVGLVIALNRIDWSQYQEPVIAQVKAATGRDLHLDGELRLRIGFRPAVAVSGVRFQNAAWSPEPEMVGVERFEVQLALLPLLFGNVEVSRLLLVGAEIRLETNAEGEGNWVFTPEPSEESAADPKPDREKQEKPVPDAPGEEPAVEEGGGQEFTAWVKEVVIEDLRLLYLDGASGESQEVRIDSLDARMDSQSAPLLLELVSRLNGEEIRLDGQVDGVGDLMAGGPVLLDLTLQAGGATVTAQGEITKPLEGSGIALALGVNGESLGTLSALAGSPVPALGPYSLSANVKDGEQRYDVEDLQLRVGSSQLAGRVGADLSGPRPRIDATLRSPLLDLADFQDPAAPAEGTGGAGSDQGGGGSKGKGSKPAAGAEEVASSDRVFSDDPLPLESLKSVDAKLKLEVERLISGGIEVSKLAVGLGLVNGDLKVAPLSLGLSGGTVGGDLGLKTSGKRPQLALKLDVSKLDVGSLLTAAEVTDLLKGGPLDAAIEIEGRGPSVRKIMAGLNGRIGLELGSGTLDGLTEGLALGPVVDLLLAGRGGKASDLNCVVTRFDVTDGIAKAAGIAVDTGGVAFVGTGDIDLRKEKLDLLLEPVVKQASADLLTPAAKIKGTLAAPEVGIDKGALLDKGVGIAAGLLGGGKVASGKGVKTDPGIAGCEQLIAGSKKKGKGKDASAAGLADDGSKKLKKKTRKAKKKGRKLLDDKLGDLLGR